METHIVAVKYEDRYIPQTFSGKCYSYFTNLKLDIGDIVEAPTQYGKSIAIVAKVNILPEEIKSIKSYMKVITKKLNKKRYLIFAEIQEEAA